MEGERTSRILGPSLVMGEALEDDVEEDCCPRSSQDAEGNVVDHLQARSGRSESFVEEHKGNLDGPER